MVNTNELPALDMEVAVPGATKHQPVVLGQVLLGIALGVVIAIED
jgi:hypothetical protein